MNPVQLDGMIDIFQETYGDESICKMRVLKRLKRIEEGSKMSLMMHNMIFLHPYGQ
jgi:hypothetical protein